MVAIYPELVGNTTLLIYNLTPKFIRFKLWKPELKTHNHYQQYQRHCILTEFKNRNNDSLKLKKERNNPMNTLKRKLQLTDYKHFEQFLYERANHVNEVTTKIHEKKLRNLKGGSIGQDYSTMKDKILHNISSYQLKQAEERILCRGMNFCIENKSTDYLDFQTDVELNMCKIEEFCHPTIFRSLYQDMYRYSKQLIINNKKKRIRNISDEELNAMRKLKNNNNIIITKADKGNAIVILDKKAYIEKAKSLLNNKQCKRTTKNLAEEKEKEMNRYFNSLLKTKFINEKLFYQLHSTCSSPAVFYGQPKIHKDNIPLRPIISTTATYNYQLSKYSTKILSEVRKKPPSFIKDSFELMKKITKLESKNNEIIISFDIDNLYTNVPVAEAIETALDVLYKDDKKLNCSYDRSWHPTNTL